ncbi:11353_t:CDS:10 [Entrophospora sp. SA101]|nr:11353_t:CDS:10 [Entrophospora sp. SA101]
MKKDGVGKSTLITSLIRETFVPNIQHVVPEVTIPPEVTPEKVITHIVDSSSRSENRDQLENEIKKAHVICIVYSIENTHTFSRLASYWLPYIRSLGVNVPVVLVGNKIDLRGDQVTNQSLEEEIIPIMNEFKVYEQCSAKQPLNVSEVFYFAQKAVLHPTAPLYDSREHVLRPACIDALKRIFSLCDTDKDGTLNDNELNEFQRKCFNAPLKQQELAGVKEVVREHEPAGVNDIGLTELGFLFLHTLFIQRGRLETTWAVLRKFGYGDDLMLREDFLFPHIDVPCDCSAELSPKGYQFFADIFQLFDKDNDGALKNDELFELFSTSPANPWTYTGFPNTTITNEAGAVTLQGWLAQWSMTTLLDHTTTLSYLAYLGFEGDTRKALKVTRPRKLDRKANKVQRNVFLVYVLGAAGSGKTSLLRAFVNKEFVQEHSSTTRTFNVVNSVEIKGSEKYLVLQEFGSRYEAEILQNKRKLDNCDLLCFVYDSNDADSFSYIVELRRNEIQPDVYCRSLGLAPPINVSVKKHYQVADLWNLLAGVAINPTIATPGLADSAHASSRIIKKYLTFTALMGAIMGAAFLAIDQLIYLFDTIKRFNINDDSDKVLFEDVIKIYVKMDIDAMCAAQIFQVENIDLASFFDLSENLNVNIYVLDSQTTLDLSNCSGSENIYIVLDLESPEIKAAMDMLTYNCVLVGHWNLYDSIMNSENTFFRMKLKNRQGENLDNLLRNLGISQIKSKEFFLEMDFETADNLSKNISEEGPKLGFNEPIYAQYVKYYGYKEPSFSASDMVYALQTLLWIKRSKINEFNIGEIDFFDVFKDTNNPWWDNFHTVLDTIEWLSRRRKRAEKNKRRN